MNPSLAVILVDYNGLADTIECIKSLLRVPQQIQIIVIDNASKKDETTDIVGLFPMVKIFRVDVNLGFAGGNNIGIKWAIDNGFEYVALLNNDTVVDENIFTHLLENIDDRSVVAPYIYYYSNPDELWYGGGYINRWTGNAKHMYTPKKGDEAFVCDFASGCCILAHRSIWEKVGVLNELYFMYNEDTDFCVRLAENGMKIKVVPSAKVLHKVGKSSGGTESPFCIYYITRNRLYCVKTHQKFFAPTAYIVSILSRYLRMLLLVLKKKKEWKAFFQGIRDSKKGVMGPSFRG